MQEIFCFFFFIFFVYLMKILPLCGKKCSKKNCPCGANIFYKYFPTKILCFRTSIFVYFFVGYSPTPRVAVPPGHWQTSSAGILLLTGNFSCPMTGGFNRPACQWRAFSPQVITSSKCQPNTHRGIHGCLRYLV